MEDGRQQQAEFTDLASVRQFLYVLGGKMSACVQSTTEDCSMSKHEFLALRALSMYGTMPVKELSTFVEGVSLSTMTRVLDRLEQQGLVERQLDANDRRSFLVRLTSAGAALAEQFGRRVDEIAQALLDKLTDQERGEFVRLAKKLTGGEVCPLKPSLK